MATVPIARNRAGSLQEEFLELVCGDEELLRAEFDSIIAQDDPSSAGAEPYVNAFVARKADAKDPLLLKLAALYHTPAITDEVQRENGGSAVFETWSPAKLQQILAKVETDAKAAE